MRDKSGKCRHTYSKADKVQDDEAKTRDKPFKKQGSQRATSRLTDANYECAENQEYNIDTCEAGIISVPLIFDLLRSLRMQVELLRR